MTSDTFSQQIKQKSLGRNCVTGLIDFSDIYSRYKDSLQESKATELELADNAKNNESAFGKMMSSIFSSTGANTSSSVNAFVGQDIDSLEDLLSAVGSTVDTIMDPLAITDAIATTATATLGTTLGAVGAFDPSVRDLLVSNTKERSKGVCGKRNIHLASNTFRGVVASYGQLKSGAREIQRITKAFAAASGSGNGFGDGLKWVVGNTLLVGLNNELSILKQICDTVQDLNKAVERLRPSDYVTNHREIAAVVKFLLDRADTSLETVNNIMLAGGALDEAGYEASRIDVETAKDILKGDYFGDLLKILPTTRMLKVVGLYVKLSLLTETFNKTSDRNREDATNFFEFDLNFTRATPGIDVLYGPIVNAIRCRLQRTVSDITDTMSKDQLLLYLLKEKQWYAEALLTLELYKGLEVFGKVKKALSSGDLMKALNFQVELDTGRMTTSYSGLRDKDTIVAYLTLYMDFVRKKINMNVPSSLVTSYGDLATFEIAEYIKERPAFHGASFVKVFGSSLPPNLQNFAASALSNPIEEALSHLSQDAQNGILLAQMYLAFLSDEDADLATEALSRGDLVTFFSFDSVVNKLGQHLAEQSLSLVACIRNDPRPNVAAMTAAKSAYEEAQDQVRASSIWKDVYYNSHEKHIQTTILTDLDVQ
jgi:hypothetical protein